jgi:hypothetical protein
MLGIRRRQHRDWKAGVADVGYSSLAGMVSLRGSLLVGFCLVGACSFERPADVGFDASPDTAPPMIDAQPVDAHGPAAFDIAYPHEWRWSVNAFAKDFLQVINTGDSVNDLLTFDIVSYSDDHPQAVVTFVEPGGVHSVLHPGSTAGALSEPAKEVLVDSGLVTETNAFPKADFLHVEVDDAPEGVYDIAVDLTIVLDGIEVDLPMTFHHEGGIVVRTDPSAGRRIELYRPQ